MKPKREYRPPRAGEVLSFLNRHASKVSPGEGLNVRFSPCPNSGCNHATTNRVDASNTIHTETGLAFCWSCRSRWNWFTLTRAFGNPLPIDDRYLHPPDVDKKKIDAGWVAMRSQPKVRRPVTAGHYPELLAYCHARGFSNETLDRWRISTKGKNTLRFPIFAWRDEPGEEEYGWSMVNARLRTSLGRDEARTAGKTVDWFDVTGGDTNLLIGNHLLNLDAPEQRVIITEGQWDAMTGDQIGLTNVFSLPNGANHVDVARMLRYIPDDWEVWLCVDMDKGGEQCAEAFFAQLGSDRLARIYMPFKDLNEWYVKSEFTLTPAQVTACAKGFTHLVQAQQTETSKGRVAIGKSTAAQIKPICDTPWDKLTFLLDGGPRPRQVTSILAPSGIGKTTALNQWCIHTASACQVGIISLEDDRDTVSANFAQAIEGYWGEAMLTEISNNLWVSDLEGFDLKWSQIEAQFEEMVRWGAKLLALDNIDFMMPRDNPTKANNLKVQCFGRLVQLSNQWDVHIVNVWQPLKIDSGAVINSGSQKGASQMLQDSQNYINLNRIDDLARMEVEKCRAKGKQKDRFVYLAYDPVKRCLFETKAPAGAAAQEANGANLFSLRRE